MTGEAGGEVPPHSHYAIQIFLALDGAAAIRCQATAPELLANYAGSAWRCGPNCACESGEQGCLCRR